jgi:hypothetical protein
MTLTVGFPFALIWIVVHTYDPLGLLRVLDDLEQFARSSNDHAAIGAVRESRGALEKLVNKMDSLETGFDRIAERSCKPLILVIIPHPPTYVVDSIISLMAFFFSTTLYVHGYVCAAVADLSSSDRG